MEPYRVGGECSPTLNQASQSVTTEVFIQGLWSMGGIILLSGNYL